MSKSENGLDRFVVTWTIVLFITVFIISFFFISHRYEVIIGLIIGTVLSLLKFLFNSHNLTKILSAKTPNVFSLVFLNTFFLGLIFLTVYILLSKLNIINIYTAVGIALGVGFIPLVIVVGGILQSLYIIRNKF